MAQKNPKPVTRTSHTLDSPFSTDSISWPPVSYQNRKVILDQLCGLLSPIGEHRLRYVKASKGKRDRRKKRIAMRTTMDAIEVTGAVILEQDQAEPAPLPPEIVAHLSIGFNSTERRLEAAAQRATPSASDACQADLKPLVAVFVDRSVCSPILYSHLPQLLTLASMASPSDPTIRLVTLPEGSTARLSMALHIPRVSILGLGRDAPNTRPLVQFIREHVPPIDIPWLKNIQEGLYLPVAINSTTRIAPAKMEKRSQPTWPAQAKKQRAKAQNTQQTPQQVFD